MMNIVESCVILHVQQLVLMPNEKKPGFFPFYLLFFFDLEVVPLKYCNCTKLGKRRNTS